tara:strand:+ start:1234 stop:1470 length:237 start_codon:yes stop_codon:yes gene_type:complete
MKNKDIEIEKMLFEALKDNGKIDITTDQLKQLELFVVAYMSAAQLELTQKELSKEIIKGLDVKWDLFFNINKKESLND